MRTDELTGELLNKWVALTLGWEQRLVGAIWMWTSTHEPSPSRCNTRRWHPSTDWAQGGPIIQAEYGHIAHQLTAWFGNRWAAHDGIVAEDILLWMMRAFVASAHGDEVPDE